MEIKNVSNLLIENLKKSTTDTMKKNSSENIILLN